MRSNRKTQVPLSLGFLGLCAEELRNIEIDEVRVMEDDRLDRCTLSPSCECVASVIYIRSGKICEMSSVVYTGLRSQE